MLNRLWLLLLVFAGITHAHADVALLLEEPYGIFGSVNPTGHAAIYLPQVCAASPTELRRCEPGEGGAVISRYYKIGGYDWIAMPLLPYLYAVDTLAEIPQSADKRSVAALREKYRRAHLLDLAPDGPNERPQNNEWVQLVGAAYIRKIYGFRIKTSQQQDDTFIQYFNDRSNKSRFSLFFANCADLAREVLNFYEPHAIHRNFLADAGITTPKQVARSLTGYARRHPELGLRSFQIEQVPGSIKRSKSADSVAEALLKSKKYVVPLVLLSPYTACGVGVAYLTGHFNPKKNVEKFDIASAFQPQPRDSEGLAAVASSKPPESNAANRNSAANANASSVAPFEETR
jgi:hypothetical protein